MKKVVQILYQWLIFVPIFAVFTILTTLLVICLGSIFGNKIWGYYPPKYWSKLACILALSKIKVTRKCKLDKKQSYVFVGNHQGAFDIFLVYGYLNCNIKWVQKQSLRKLPFVGKASEIAGHVFVDNSSHIARKRTIDKAKEKIKDGVSIMLFPEGARSETGKMNRFSRGAFKIAMDMGLPIVPLTLNGPYDILKIGNSQMNIGKKMELVIHDPIPTAGLTEADIPELMLKTKESIESSLWEKYK